MQTIKLEIPLRDAGKLAALALAHGTDLATYLAHDVVKAANSGELTEDLEEPTTPAEAATDATPATSPRFGSLR